MTIAINDLWTAAGVLLGFQVTSFLWRIGRETDIAEGDDIIWLPPADIVNLAGMSVLATGVFILPTIGIHPEWLGPRALGVAALLFVGHCFALVGHYELYNPRTKRSYAYFPFQEKLVVGGIAVAVLVYLFVAITG